MQFKPSKAEVIFCASCRISAGHHKYFASGGESEAYFRSKRIFSANAYSAVRNGLDTMGSPEPAGSVHVDAPMSAVSRADYFCYKNEVDSIFYVNRIVGVEYVNANSCRVHFVPDYWATYIGYINFGWCYVIRQHPENDILGEYMQTEPITVPLAVKDCQFSELEEIVESNHKDMAYIAVSSAAEDGLSNKSEVKFATYLGCQCFGYVRVFKEGNDAAEWLKRYLNSSVSSLLQNQFSNASALQKFFYAPSICGIEGNTGRQELRFSDPDKPQYKWSKMYSPQFYHFEITAASTGETMQLDLYKQSKVDPQGGKNTNAQGTARVSGSGIEWTLWYYITGVPFPQSALALNYYGNPVRSEPDELITQNMYPEVPIYGMFNSPATAMGQANMGRKVFNSGTIAATGAGAAAGAGVGSVVPGIGTAVGSAVGAAAGFLWKAGGDMLSELINASTPQSYTFMGSAGVGITNAYLHYSFNTTKTAPTKEGQAILEAYFNTFGYQQNRRLQLRLNIRANFTYTRIGAGATFTSTTAPQIAIDAIRNMLEQGMTVWTVDIGSTEDCG